MLSDTQARALRDLIMETEGENDLSIFCLQRIDRMLKEPVRRYVTAIKREGDER